MNNINDVNNKMDKEYFQRLLKEKQKLANSTVEVYNQLLGQASLLEFIIAEIEKLEKNQSIEEKK